MASEGSLSFTLNWAANNLIEEFSAFEKKEDFEEASTIYTLLEGLFKTHAPERWESYERKKNLSTRLSALKIKFLENNKENIKKQK